MALSPRFAGLKLAIGNSPAQNLHTVELWLDYVCPFSAKQFNTFYNQFVPSVRSGSPRPYSDKVQFIFRPQIQPWHPSSTLVHEAALAVLQLSPNKFWDFSSALMEKQKDYFDVSVVNETRNQTYKRLAKLGSSVGVEEGKMYEMLQISEDAGEDGGLNTGNHVTNDLKVCIKQGRMMGIHVSPSVVFNGVMEPSISSSFSADDWDKWLAKNCS